ncbi:hypothetical protein HELRODRAFT_80178 [Helobdella robusta]|uniref:5'-Nucleotidase C-terminal domain-containing protein n=1 Tax=Helobdella robusta TaxID=6412 RepID=T1G3Y6_HELRO|nr:hypothetical protein HELRODRAFT_80178 [Helobdella robusta]ESO03811.1 hypothetical protein HELRODRAFT_80178 [Helobdella robusta]
MSPIESSAADECSKKTVLDVLQQLSINSGSSVDPSACNIKKLYLIHFNDVYNVESRKQEPVGGAARFTTAIHHLQHLNPLILFSGDIFNPSSMSTITKGRQMVPIMNRLNIHYSLFGNHDFDHGMDVLDELVQGTNCRWLMSNALDATTEQPFGNGIVSDLFEWNGVNVGLIGLVERDWIDCLATFDPEDVEVLDFVEEGRTLALELLDQGADIVIALTHMRWPNDIKLAEQVPEISLVLGGHDHDFTFKKMKDNYILKSGTDFREFSLLTLTFEGSKFKDIEVQKIEVTSNIEEDQVVRNIVEDYSREMAKKLDEVLGVVEVDLDGLFSSVRTKETNLGNFLTDIMLAATEANIAFLNSGTIRSDTIHPRGEFKLRDLVSIIPMVEPLVVLKINGCGVLEALENSVSKYPSLEGRFAQVSGVTFGFDPKKPPGHRIDPRHVKVQGEYLVLDKEYKLVTKAYLAEGKDGYDVFKRAEKLTDPDDGQSISTEVQNHFHSVKVLKGEVRPKFVHRQSIINLSR